MLLSLTRIGEVRTYQGVFQDCGASVSVLPWIDVYGVRLLSRVISGFVVALALPFFRASIGVDLVITRGALDSIPLVMASKLANIKLLYTAPAIPLAHMQKGFVKPTHARLYYFLAKLADYFVLRNADFWGLTSSSAQHDLTKLLGKDAPKKMTFLPIPIPEEFFAAGPSEKDDREVTLVFNGSISYLYDFGCLISALRKMNSEGRRVYLTIRTSVTDRKHLSSLLGAQDESYLRLQAPVPRPEIIGTVRRATAVVIPLSRRAKSEGGIPIKAIEAMALRVPVIISNPNDPIFQDGVTCVVVPGDSPQAWEKAISQIADSDYRKSIVDHARVLAEQFRSRRNVEIVSQLLDDRCQEPRFPLSSARETPY